MSNIEKAIIIFTENGFQEEAKVLTKLSLDLYSEEQAVALEAAETLGAVCSIQSWGNLNIKTMNGWKWNHLLEKIGNAAERRARKIREQIT